MIASTLSISIVEGNPERASLLSDYLSKDFAKVKIFTSVLNMLEGDSHPSIVLLDMHIPGMNGPEDVTVIKRKFTEAEIIMMSSLCDSERVFSSICAGASGYLEKGSPLPEIKNAIIDLSRGGFPITPEMTRKVFTHLQPAKRMNPSLTNRENEVVQGLLDGLS
jgi:DNA-binding NarL/FixJ family response regulator